MSLDSKWPQVTASGSGTFPLKSHIPLFWGNILRNIISFFRHKQYLIVMTKINIFLAIIISYGSATHSCSWQYLTCLCLFISRSFQQGMKTHKQVKYCHATWHRDNKHQGRATELTVIWPIFCRRHLHIQFREKWCTLIRWLKFVSNDLMSLANNAVTLVLKHIWPPGFSTKSRIWRDKGTF